MGKDGARIGDCAGARKSNEGERGTVAGRKGEEYRGRLWSHGGLRAKPKECGRNTTMGDGGMNVQL